MTFANQRSLKRLSKSRDVSHNVSTLTLHLQDEKENITKLTTDDENTEFIKQFRSRRKHRGSWKTPGIVDRYNSISRMELAGTKYLDYPENIAKETTPINPPENKRNTNQSTNDDSEKKLFGEKTTMFAASEKNSRLPAIASSNTITRQDVGTKSYLRNEFGFNTVRTDTFIGLQTAGSFKRKNTLDEHIAFQARRHLFACGNVGSVRTSCRANESIMGLKQTMVLDSKVQTPVTMDIKSSHLIPERLQTGHKLSRVFTRGEITRRSVINQKHTALPEINGYSILSKNLLC